MSLAPDTHPYWTGLMAELAREPNPRRRRQLLQAHADLWRPDDRKPLLRRSGPPAARGCSAGGTHGPRRLPDWPTGWAMTASRAAGLRALGHIYYRKRKYEASRRSLPAVAGHLPRPGQRLEAGRTLNSSLQSLIYLGRYARGDGVRAAGARDLRTRGRPAAPGPAGRQHGQHPVPPGSLRRGAGTVSARLPAFVEIGEPQDVAISLKNTATCQISLNDFREALATYQKARAYCVEHRDAACWWRWPITTSPICTTCAANTPAPSNFTAPLARTAASWATRTGRRLCDLDQSEMYLELNLSEEGAHLAGRAQKAFLALGMGYEAAKAQTNLAISLTHHGETGCGAGAFPPGAAALRPGKQPRLDRYHRSVPGPGASPGRPPGRGARTVPTGHWISSHRRRCSPRACCASCCWRASTWIAARAKRPGASARLHWTVWSEAETPALSYQAWYVLGVIEEALGAPAAAHRAYLKAHDYLENLRSHLQGGGNEDRLPQGQAGGLRGAGAHVAGAGAPSDAACETAFGYMEQAKSRSLADLIAFRSQGLPASRKTERALVEQVEYAARRAQLV